MRNLDLMISDENRAYVHGVLERFGGILYGFQFPNGYGASVIKHDASLGRDEDLWELAVTDSKFRILRDTPIAADVIGYLTDDEVNSYLERIKAL